MAPEFDVDPIYKIDSLLLAYTIVFAVTSSQWKVITADSLIIVLDGGFEIDLILAIKTRVRAWVLGVYVAHVTSE